MPRSYYSKNFPDFLNDDSGSILSELTVNHQFASLSQQQRDAWIDQIEILKNELRGIDFEHILFEYSIPRMGKRADNILFYHGVLYLLEFKVNSKEYPSSDLRQAHDYALDLKNFQEESKDIVIVPILVSTNAPDFENKIVLDPDKIVRPLKANTKTLKETILQASKEFKESAIDAKKWENSNYKPTPTIIEAAQALYNNHTVDEITRSDSDVTTFRATTDSVDKIIEDAKKNKKKSIVFVTGIPGSGKTLVGLNIATKSQNYDKDEHAVYLSGTAPIIEVLREALARNKVENAKIENPESKITKAKAKKDTETFYQHVRHFRKEALEPDSKPTEKIVIFDEAQRTWSKPRMAREMKTKFKIEGFDKSEADVFLGYMDRHQDWSVIVCLIGGGQEINEGEDGTIEWLSSVQKKFSHWNVFLPFEIRDKLYVGDSQIDQILKGINHEFIENLHLKTSVRSFRSENMSNFVNNLLDHNMEEASKIFSELKEKYPIRITRDIQKAKEWVKSKARGSERYGIFTTTKSQRLRPEGIYPSKPMEFKTEAWFLDSPEYVDSSYYMEIPATEFNCQGLEVDWSVVAWDASLRPTEDDWSYHKFSRKAWNNINKEDAKRFLKNAHRVLLTRARQGMIIFIPKGDERDLTRLPEFYDGVYDYFKEIGIKEI